MKNQSHLVNWMLVISDSVIKTKAVANVVNLLLSCHEYGTVAQSLGLRMRPL